MSFVVKFHAMVANSETGFLDYRKDCQCACSSIFIIHQVLHCVAHMTHDHSPSVRCLGAVLWSKLNNDVKQSEPINLFKKEFKKSELERTVGGTLSLLNV